MNHYDVLTGSSYYELKTAKPLEGQEIEAILKSGLVDHTVGSNHPNELILITSGAIGPTRDQIAKVLGGNNVEEFKKVDGNPLERQ